MKTLVQRDGKTFYLKIEREIPRLDYSISVPWRLCG